MQSAELSAFNILCNKCCYISFVWVKASKRFGCIRVVFLPIFRRFRGFGEILGQIVRQETASGIPIVPFPSPLYTYNISLLSGRSSKFIHLVTFAKLSRTPCYSFVGPMWGNYASCEDSVISCQAVIYYFMLAL